MEQPWSWNGWSSSGVPLLQQEGGRGEEARRFVQVVARAGEICPWVHPIRLGVCALPARGPARFFGGEEMVVRHLVEAVEEDGSVGVADGLFAAILAARSQLIVPAGEVAQFLAPWSVAALARPELAVTLQRLGVTTLGQFAALPAPHVSDRFGADAAACHRLCRGESGELAGVRDRAIDRRLRVARGRIPTRGPSRLPSSPGSSVALRRRRPGRPFPSPGCRSGWESMPCWWAGYGAAGIRPSRRRWCRGGARRPRGLGRAALPGRDGCPLLPPPVCSVCHSGPRWSTPPVAPWW